MDIIYGYSNCTDKKYNEIFSGKSVAVLQPDQKYHGLLIKGLAENGANVYCYSGLPLNRNVTKKLFIHEPDEQEGNAHFHYYRTFNLPVLRQLMIMQGAKKAVKKHKSKDKTVIICDCLNRSNAIGMLKAGKKRKIPVIMIVTDIPDFQFDEKGAEKCNQMLEEADGFIFLTEQMNARLNKHNKPYIVLEGHSDASLSAVDKTERYERTDGKKVVLYAGSLLRLYGIQNLVEGFLEAKLPDTELWIYGDGDYREELETIAKEQPSVQYKGVRPNAEIVYAEQRAALLVNPRPSAPEYTKYSFPSKNMEYMVSGTPVLTTKLPGMPTEYYPHVYLLEEETPRGISEKLQEIFKAPIEFREEKGLAAREFVLSCKTNVAQAKKIIEFMQEKY